MADTPGPAGNGHDPQLNELKRTLGVLIDAVADTNRNVAALTADMSSLTRVVRLHLIHDHGYEDPDANDDT
jgi:hypothetical protein